MIVVLLDLGDHELPWYCACHRFETAEDAYAAFVRVHEREPDGSLDMGVFRHQRIGLDAAPVLVSVVSLKKASVELAEELMDGEPTELHPASWLELIKRRAQKVLDLASQGATSGRYRIVHDEGMKL